MAPTESDTDPADASREPTPSDRRVPLASLIDLEALSVGGRAPSPRRIREALPPGWVPAEDGIHAVRDGRILFRESWVLLAGLIVFGLLGGIFLVGAMPKGWGGWLRLAGMLALLLLVGGFAAPRITRGLHRR
ncbi:MAG TPA: hypothetical protein ENJ09_08295 [Planctomycetes bacterium]|nr:hypothetical protein [Planctomycetota bacterium]